MLLQQKALLQLARPIRQELLYKGQQDTDMQQLYKAACKPSADSCQRDVSCRVVLGQLSCH